MSRYPSRLSNAALLLLVLTCLGLSRIVYGELAQPAPRLPAHPPTPAASPSASSAAADDRFTLPPLASLSAISDRPLFSLTRRPPEDQEKSLGQLATFILDGVRISPDGRAAIVIHGAPPTVAHVSEGQEIEGWSVSAILPDRIVLRHNGTEHELRLRDKGRANAPASGPPRRRGRD
jgi:general secretion pathway protein N